MKFIEIPGLWLNKDVFFRGVLWWFKLFSGHVRWHVPGRFFFWGSNSLMRMGAATSPWVNLFWVGTWPNLKQNSSLINAGERTMQRSVTRTPLTSNRFAVGACCCFIILYPDPGANKKLGRAQSRVPLSLFVSPKASLILGLMIWATARCQNKLPPCAKRLVVDCVQDLRNYIKGLSMAPGKDMKGVLETFAHSPKAHTPENGTPEPVDTQ